MYYSRGQRAVSLRSYYDFICFHGGQLYMGQTQNSRLFSLSQELVILMGPEALSRH